MFRAWVVLGTLAVRLASAQGPVYASDSILNGADFVPGPFAVNSVISLFGSNLSYSPPVGLASNATSLPLQLGGVQVSINGLWAPLIYVSPTQINLLVPGYFNPGNVNVVVNRQGWYGPTATITLVPVAPQLFATSDGFVIAQHADYSQITSNAPAVPGETIILYVTGLGADPSMNTIAGEADIPGGPAPTNTNLQVLFNGTAVASWANGGNQGTSNIQYAGVTPGSPGIYQINLILPGNLPANPQIQVTAGGQTSAANIILPTQPSGN